MDKYNYNWEVLIYWKLPTLKRKPKFIAWLHGLFKYMRTLHSNFLIWGAEKKDQVIWNSQTMVLRSLLIKKFGAGIYIVNLTRKATLFLGWPFTDSRNIISYAVPSTNNRIGYPFGEYDMENVGFIVYVPSSLVFDQDQMEATINYYLLFGTNYKIEIYTP